jgi:hypothetical protein
VANGVGTVSEKLMHKMSVQVDILVNLVYILMAIDYD